MARVIDETVANESMDVEGGHHGHHEHVNTCGISALRFFGFPVEPVINGPFSVAYLNELILPFGVKLMLDTSGLPGRDGKYLCHRNNHFTGIDVREGHITQCDNGNLKNLTWCNLADVAKSCAVYRLAVCSKDVCAAGCLTDLSGGTSGVLKRPSASGTQVNVEKPEYSCPLEQCVCELSMWWQPCSSVLGGSDML